MCSAWRFSSDRNLHFILKQKMSSYFLKKVDMSIESDIMYWFAKSGHEWEEEKLR